MTANKHFKKLIRSRMAAAGETFSTARSHVLAAQADVALQDPVVVQVHGRHGQTVAFTPDGKRLLSGGQDARIAILDAASGRVESELRGHEKVVNGVAVSPANATRAVSVSSDRTVRIWDLDQGNCVAAMDGHHDAVVAVDISPGGEEATTGGYDGRLRIWDLAGRSCRQEIRSDLKRVGAVAYTPTGRMIVESGQGPDVYVRDVSSGEVLTRLDTGAPGVTGLAVAPEGAILATAGYDGTVMMWDCDSWEPIRRLDVGERANAACFSRSGQLLAVAASARVIVWSHRSEQSVADAVLPISGVYAVAISGDAKRLAQTGADGKIRIWTLR